MDGRILLTLRIFVALFEKIPMIEARVLLPSAVLLVAFPVLSHFWPEAPEFAFVVSFILCQVARFSLRWREQFARESRRIGECAVKKRIIGALLIPGAVLVASQHPLLCQHVPSLISIGFVLLFAADALDRSYSTARAYWPGQAYAPYARELTLAMVILHLTYILLNETMITAVSLTGWMVFYALMPLLHHVLLTAVFRSVFWLVPEPGRR